MTEYYICPGCGVRDERTTLHETMIAEYEREFGNVPMGDAIICDDCYQELMANMRRAESIAGLPRDQVVKALGDADKN